MISVSLSRHQTQSPQSVVTIVCLAEILSMTPFSMFLALQPQLQQSWHLSNTASGWISSAYFTGYMLAVPVLGTMTDRVDARTVWLGACALAGVGSAGFGALADGPVTAASFQLIAGAGLAGTYMPGLKVITDRLSDLPSPRHVAFYTTSFTLGSSLSFWIIGHLGSHVPWREAVAVSAVGPLLGCMLVWLALTPAAVTRHSHVRADGHLRAVVRSAPTMRYVVGYAAHVWELFALRAWIVPFLVFCESVRGAPPPVAVATLASAVAIVGVPASLAGAELTSHRDRNRVIVTVMLVSFAVSLLVVPAGLGSWTLIISAVIGYSACISADSAALTSGLVAVAPPESRGTAMALYSTLGFAAASAGTFAVGWTLDLLGGQSLLSWSVAFALMGIPNLIGAAIVSRTTTRVSDPPSSPGTPV